mmetsp:Transcript_12320/g.14072  ORF Transcript_12320/g.14072 Transcript_12320/m.14072 type:complete len:102 (+) Transcript_12320:241-546(+)
MQDRKASVKNGYYFLSPKPSVANPMFLMRRNNSEQKYNLRFDSKEAARGKLKPLSLASSLKKFEIDKVCQSEKKIGVCSPRHVFVTDIKTMTGMQTGPADV